MIARFYLLSMIASTSSSRMMRYSWPSILISWPEYLPEKNGVPALDVGWLTAAVFPDLPSPTAKTVPRCGFSFALSGTMMPPTVCSPSSRR
jgi:hypothetical protein